MRWRQHHVLRERDINFQPANVSSVPFYSSIEDHNLRLSKPEKDDRAHREVADAPNAIRVFLGRCEIRETQWESIIRFVLSSQIPNCFFPSPPQRKVRTTSTMTSDATQAGEQKALTDAGTGNSTAGPSAGASSATNHHGKKTPHPPASGIRRPEANSHSQNSQINISQVEFDALKRVFLHIDRKRDYKLDHQEIAATLQSLGYTSQSGSTSGNLARDVDLMIWEVDDDLDHFVSWDEFLIMYQRCVEDHKTGLEPRNLFHLVQFLMYDRDFTGTISVEQTLQILFVRFGREKLDAEIQEIFGSEQKKMDEESRIGFDEFIRRQQQRLTRLRNTKKTVSKVLAIK